MTNNAVWDCLQQRKITEEILLKRWKRKSYFLLGKAKVGAFELKDAIVYFKGALSLLGNDVNYVKEANDLRMLISTNSKKLEKEEKAEKAIWSKAFKKNEEIETKAEEAANKAVSSSKMASLLGINPSSKPAASSSAVVPKKSKVSTSNSLAWLYSPWLIGGTTVLGLGALFAFAFLKPKLR